MTTPWRRRARRTRRVLAYGTATLLILAAVAVALANQFLPLIARHPERVAAWLSERIGQPVTLDAVTARWSRSGPLLTVDGLRLGSGDDAFEVAHADLLIRIYAGVLPNVPLTELRLRGLDLRLARDADGRWKLDGLSAAPQQASPLKRLENVGELRVEQARLRLSDAESGRSWDLPRIDARLRAIGGRFRLGVRAAGRGDDGTLHAVADVTHDLRSGRLYLEGRARDWLPLLGDGAIAGIDVLQASGTVQVWADVGDGALQSARAELALAPLVLRGAAPVQIADRSFEPRYGIESVRGALRWQRDADGWRADAADLVFDSGDTAMTVGALAVRSSAADGWRVRADALEVSPLLSLFMLSERGAPGLRRWLFEASPRGRIDGLDLHWRDRAQFDVRATVTGLGWQPAGSMPVLQGVTGRIDGDAQALRLQLTPGAWRVEVPGVLRGPFVPQVDGEILAFRTADAWRIETPALHLMEPDYQIALAGGIELQDDGSRPLLDLRADVGAAPITAAKRFWVINKMPPKAVEWLDEAFEQGRVTHGSALFRGDADDWPFAAGEGRFEAHADVADTRLRFRNDWPVGENVNGSATFVNAGLTFDVRGTLTGNSIAFARGGIENLRDPILAIDAEGEGTGGTLLTLLRRSPLQEKFGSYLDGLSIGGEARVQVGLVLPLKKELGEPRVEGQADLVRADLRDSKWDLAFDGASGRVRFSEKGFSAEELNVGFGGAVATLNVAVGDYTSSEAWIAQASLRGRFGVDALLAPREALHWLRPWLRGESNWVLELSVPRGDGARAAVQNLRVASDLVGTAIDLPAPLRKPAEERLRLVLDVGLPTTDGAIDLHLGQLLRLRGRLSDASGFAGVAAFGDAPEVPIPTTGLIAVGQVPVLDAAGWAGVALSGSGSGGGGLLRADLHAGELDVLDRAFAETRLRFERDGDESIRFDLAGATLQGNVTVPLRDLPTRGISADFERLHWPSAAPGAGATPVATDPAAIPPLHLQIADLKFGDARLGQARLETYPTPEGMHVERLETKSQDMELHARGDWTRIDGRERSNFRLDFSSHDLGAMLVALGFSELIDGGDTVAELQATWPGAPSAFDFERLDGRLSTTVGKGRVLEVEPGAGRLFGLLSLTEIPRRLALDFSDFFKSGLAFNQISGSFVLDGGNAYTEDLRIDGPAAEIQVRGRTGLKAKDYDQTMEVLPKASSMLPAIGALAAGPAGAAIGAVAQAVLQRPLKQMTRKYYRVQGTWAEPVIETIERGAEPAGPARQAPDAPPGNAPNAEPPAQAPPAERSRRR
ncbi:YhdP family protein [Chiayiivirga flava]|uniref:Uncharacterized protein (TIGR02099 family) n=1 Tax=Chiayiivirga flava TaxID=659595 RepID=A0A7W8D5Z6_9GAMM|nr:YhdP family protein [Chiayiivirga flava]MBB5208559.1 uncharacterized protein (TIGR02099 family) [Chiayiivirga flava]